MTEEESEASERMQQCSPYLGNYSCKTEAYGEIEAYKAVALFQGIHQLHSISMVDKNGQILTQSKEKMEKDEESLTIWDINI